MIIVAGPSTLSALLNSLLASRLSISKRVLTIIARLLPLSRPSLCSEASLVKAQKHFQHASGNIDDY